MCVCGCVYACVCLCVQRTTSGNASDLNQRHRRRQNPQARSAISTRALFAISPPPPRRPISLTHLLAAVFVCVLLASMVHLKSAFLCKQTSASFGNVCSWAWVYVSVRGCLGTFVCTKIKKGTAPEHHQHHTRQRHPQTQVPARRADTRLTTLNLATHPWTALRPF